MPDAAPLSTVVIEHVGTQQLVIRYQILEEGELVEQVKRCSVGDKSFTWSNDGLVYREERGHKGFAVVWGKSYTKTEIRRNAGGDLVFDTTVKTRYFEVPIFPVVRTNTAACTIVLPRLRPDAEPVFRATPVTHGAIPDCRDVKDQDDVVMLDYNIRLKPPCSVASWVKLRDPGAPGSLFFGYGATILCRGRRARNKWDYILGVADGHLSYLGAGALGRVTVTSREAFPLNRWVFVAVTHEEKTVKLYQDGRLVGIDDNVNVGDPVHGAPTTLGGIFDPNIPGQPLDIQVFSSIWRGSIVNLTVHDKALTPAEVEDRYVKGAGNML
jgi:hypothetical protein